MAGAAARTPSRRCHLPRRRTTPVARHSLPRHAALRHTDRMRHQTSTPTPPTMPWHRSAPRTRPAEQRASDRRDGRYQCGRERDQHHAGHRSRPFIGLHQPRAIGSHGRWSPRLNSLRHRVFLSSLFHRIRGKLRRGSLTTPVAARQPPPAGGQDGTVAP